MNSFEKTDYENHTYEELSNEFQQLYPSAFRAFQLIPLMNRLVLIEKKSHIEACRQLYQYHKDFAGFGRGNIYRYLSSHHLNIPKRLVTLRHKPRIDNLETSEYIKLFLLTIKKIRATEELRGQTLPPQIIP